MNYIIVNYGLNESYLVHKQAFLQSVKLVFEKNKDVSLDSEINITFNNENSNIMIEAAYSILNSKQKFSEITDILLNSIKEVIKFLIGVEPDNICLQYNGVKKNK
ncbi:MMB_0454 family protein [[Mycoplasma] collis]|uniref:MMB_0454 family protein n=1 Tax=[Mycoplasma] collis TaxID=2127 RepID=UPI00051B5C1B|nr:hypothetical protein [[Mycoplasma] collis]